MAALASIVVEETNKLLVFGGRSDAGMVDAARGVLDSVNSWLVDFATFCVRSVPGVLRDSRIHGKRPRMTCFLRPCERSASMCCSTMSLLGWGGGGGVGVTPGLWSTTATWTS